MNLELQLCGIEDKYIVNNIYPLYLYDLYEIWERKTNRYGIFEADETQTLFEQNRKFDIWWEHPGVLFPYLIKVDHFPAGLAFVATAPYIPCPGSIDYYLNEFFLLRHYRGKGIGVQAMCQLFDKMPGNWALQTNHTERNGRAIAFWRKTLDACTNGDFSEEMSHHPEAGAMLRFDATAGEKDMQRI